MPFPPTLAGFVPIATLHAAPPAPYGRAMTTRLTLILAVLIVGGLAADHFLNGGNATLFALREFRQLIDWVAFWR